MIKTVFISFVIFIAAVVGYIYWRGSVLVLDMQQQSPADSVPAVEQAPQMPSVNSAPEQGGMSVDISTVATTTRIVNMISVDTQKPGSLVVVSSITLEAKGFVVIHEVLDGKPAAVIGSSALLSKGQLANVQVAVKSLLQNGKSYIAMLHYDNGDGVFDLATDAPFLGTTDIVMTEFTVK